MYKKHILLITLSHFLIQLSSFLPVVRIEETRLGISGEYSSFVEYISVFEFFRVNVHVMTTVFTVAILVAEGLGIIHCLYLLLRKRELTQRHVGIMFLFAFPSATLGALQLYEGSYIFFAICAFSFFLTAITSIKLMKKEII